MSVMYAIALFLKTFLTFLPQYRKGSRPDLAVETGFDEFAFGGDEFNEVEIELSKNFGKGKCFPGGPVCAFGGRKITMFSSSLHTARGFHSSFSNISMTMHTSGVCSLVYHMIHICGKLLTQRNKTFVSQMSLQMRRKIY